MNDDTTIRAWAAGLIPSPSWAKSSELHETLSEWLEAHGHPSRSPRAMSHCLQDMGFTRKRSNGAHYWMDPTVPDRDATIVSPTPGIYSVPAPDGVIGVRFLTHEELRKKLIAIMDECEAGLLWIDEGVEP